MWSDDPVMDADWFFEQVEIQRRADLAARGLTEESCCEDCVHCHKIVEHGEVITYYCTEMWGEVYSNDNPLDIDCAYYEER